MPATPQSAIAAPPARTPALPDTTADPDAQDAALHASHDGSITWRATTREADMQLVSSLGAAGRRRLANADLLEGLRLFRLFTTLGWLDIKIRYRGSVLGPFWLTLSSAVLVVTLGVVYSELFHLKLHDFLPFIALSLTLWNFLSLLVGEACVVFTQAETTIRSMRMPFFVFAGQSVYRNILVLGHNLVVIVAVFALYRIWPGAHALALLPALLLWLVDSVAITLLLGAFCARFRDVPPIVASVLQIAFYVSPVIWKPEMLPAAQRGWLLYNPFYSLFEIVRAPMLGTLPSTDVWLSAMAFSVLLCLLTWFGFVRVRGRIAFWI